MSDLMHMPIAQLETIDIQAMVNLLFNRNVRSACLTFAAEIAGKRWPNDQRVYVALAHLLTHESPVVREGALYGLAHFKMDAGMMHSLNEIAQHDVSKTLREIAAELVADASDSPSQEKT